MAESLPFLDAEALDAMTPNERLAEFRRRLVTDLEQLPPELRDRFIEVGRQVDRDIPKIT